MMMIINEEEKKKKNKDKTDKTKERTSVETLRVFFFFVLYRLTSVCFYMLNFDLK